MRQCPFRGCKARIPSERFACGQHWHALTLYQQRTIRAAYSRYLCGDIAIERLTKTLAGHYELSVRKNDTRIRGVHTIEVQINRRGAEVMARSTYVDRD